MSILLLPFELCSRSETPGSVSLSFPASTKICSISRLATRVPPMVSCGALELGASARTGDRSRYGHSTESVDSAQLHGEATGIAPEALFLQGFLATTAHEFRPSRWQRVRSATLAPNYTI